jgi:hypothetical protein
LSDWKTAENSMKIYHSGIIANHTILSRSIGFGKDGKKSKAEEFIWTPAKRRQVGRLHIRLSNAAIAAKMGCQEQDLFVILGERSKILDIFSHNLGVAAESRNGVDYCDLQNHWNKNQQEQD